MEETTTVHDPKARVLALISREFDQRISESVPLRRYYRSLTEIYRMASVYVTDGNMEAALILFTRYSWYITEGSQPEGHKSIFRVSRNKASKVSKEEKKY